MKRLSFAGISLASALAFLFLLFNCNGAQAATITVTSAADSGAGTLRQAILDAAPGDTINFSLPAGTTAITLTSDELEIHQSLAISGPGANLLSVVRGRAPGQPFFDFRIFRIDGGNVTISGLTIANGLYDLAGGIFNQSNGAVTIAGCAISGNSSSAGGEGGAIETSSGTNGTGEMTIVNCTISGNSGDYGGGISNYGTLIITSSTISGNSARLGGGGIYNNADGTVAITNSTIFGNSVNQNGGGIVNTNGANSNGMNIRNTIIAKNTAANAAPDVEGTLTSQGFNLIGNNSGATITPAQVSDQIGSPGFPIDPMLGPLQDNGGPTRTHALQPASPATDKGDSSGSTTDQRGLPRPVDSPNIPNATGGDGSDIGAYEDQLPCQTLVTNNSDSGSGSLRAAIASACTGATITFASSVVTPINLTNGELLIQRPMTINGPGANLMTVQRNVSASTNFSIFHVSAAGIVNISGLTITKGNPDHNGGGIYVDNGSTLFLADSAVTGNSPINDGVLTSSGGGIATGGFGTPSVTIVRSAISGNSATNDGGGIAAGSLTIDTSTISGNTAARYGGGISVSGTTNIINSTIANNSAATGGGLRGNGSSVTASNSIFANNTATTTDPDFSGTLSSHGYNLIGNNMGTSITGTTTGNQLNVNPLLGPLQYNGGPTQTCALLTGSPAIDQGQPYGIATPDQRGANRPYDDPNIPNAPGANGEDIGAFEVSTLTPRSAVSRKTHGGTGTFDINLPLTGNPGIECRSGGATNDYQVLLYFGGGVTFSSAAITAGTGTVSSTSGGAGEIYVIVNLTGITNAQRITVTLFGASNGVSTGDVSVQMGVLVGDTNGNGSVNSSDVSQTKSQSGQPVTGSNFREDVNTNGSINSSDVSLVKSKSGSALP